MVADWFAEREMSTAMPSCSPSCRSASGVAPPRTSAASPPLVVADGDRGDGALPPPSGVLDRVRVPRPVAHSGRRGRARRGARAGLAAREVGLVVSAASRGVASTRARRCRVAFGPAMLMARRLSLGRRRLRREPGDLV